MDLLIDQRLMDPHLVQQDFIVNDTVFHNSQGHLRLSLAHKYFGLEKQITGCKYIERSNIQLLVPTFQKHMSHELSQDEIQQLVEVYTEWRDQPEYLPLRLTYENNNDGSIKKQWNFMKISKRGNDVYVKKIKDAFKPFTDASNLYFQQIIWFDPDFFQSKKTHMLYVTLEYDASKHELCNSWFNVGSDFNSFITNVRRKFTGCSICKHYKNCTHRKEISKRKDCSIYKKLKHYKIVFLRGWHAHLSGYPHIHILLYFRDQEFTSTLFNGVWRLTRSKRFKGSKQTIKQDISDCWDHGFVDVRCISDTKKAFKDLIKYTTNDFGFGKEERLAKGKCDLTNALLWFFGKQSYGLSKDFFDALFGEDNGTSRSIDLIDANEISAITPNSNLTLREIEVLPIVPPKFLGITTNVFELIGVKPPPKIELDLENMIDECIPRVIQREDDVIVTVYRRRYV